ncbi:MAG: valine--pyruvate transaminase [Gammaproteobacteria bacterium]|nr:valine--pyruvate transaminase [Gammaproteobacteria bacterium]
MELTVISELSAFGARFSQPSGTRQLMDDLGQLHQLADQFSNLGGGNPSRIPEVHRWFAAKLAALATTGDLDKVWSAYDDPRGNNAFIQVISRFFAEYFRRSVTPANVICTPGSQASFFMLFNLFGGTTATGVKRKIFLPQSPEYIGYSDLGVESDMLVTQASRVTFTAPHRFKYDIDFEAITLDDRIGAICISRPTNPTGNVVSDEDLARLAALAAAHEIPLIVDCAYGAPFPGIIFTPSELTWRDGMILCFSLSKLGAPGLRTGIVLAQVEVIDVLASMSATMFLSNNSIGACLTQELFESRAVLEFATKAIRPYYEARSRQCLAYCDELFAGLDYFVHESGGAIFLWVWFRNLPISAQMLYARLKQRRVLVIPGHHFAPGQSAPAHVSECIRISYAQTDETLRHALAIIAEEVRAAFAGRSPHSGT